MNNGHPADKLGWAASAGVSFALAGGDRLAFNGQYSVGASGYGATIGQLWSILSPGKSIGIGFASDGVFGTGTRDRADHGVERDRLLRAHLEPELAHQRVRRLREGRLQRHRHQHHQQSPADAAGRAGCACGVPVFGAVWPTIGIGNGAGNSCNPDFSFYEIGTRTQWNPVPQLDIGLDLLYTRLNTAYKGAAPAGVNPGLPQPAGHLHRRPERVLGATSAGSATSIHDRLSTIERSTSRPRWDLRRGFLDSAAALDVLDRSFAAATSRQYLRYRGRAGACLRRP